MHRIDLASLRSKRRIAALLLLVLALGAGLRAASAQKLSPLSNGIVLTDGASKLEVRLLESGVASVHVLPDGRESARTPVLAPAAVLHPSAQLTRSQAHGICVLASSQLRVEVELAAPHAIVLKDAAGHELLRAADPLADARVASVSLQRQDREPLYGVHGIGLHDANLTVERNNGGVVAAGIQGDSGAPLLFTHRYAVLVDSDGGEFTVAGDAIRYLCSSRPDVEFFVFAGKPLETMAALSRLVGPPSMPPRWTLGFINSQWGADEAEFKKIISTYRERKLPIDGFIFDFDWKAWGEDNYGEWRWNSTNGAGAVGPNKFPDGASGAFANWATQQGIHLGGILKPRILTTLADGKTPTEAAAYATAHNFWYPGQKILPDYFSHRPARDIDFNNAEARTWYWQHLQPAFRAGMVAWWNDEADESGGVPFNNLQFLNMGRAIYDGQRASSDTRVWTINRNFYLGASRYAYAGWSGDIDTGFASMAAQRSRMMAALNTGEFAWSMDTGGFNGHPSNENYARWMQFAAFVPIMRVHGGLNEKRQPWVYGPVAEAAARKALELRSALRPYIYSYMRLANEGEVGLVRPLGWQFPDDVRAAGETSEWMFGDALLVAPVVAEGATAQTLYLPAGEWFDYASGKKYSGAQTLSLSIDNKSWQDLPLFIRSGSILATQPVLQFEGERALAQMTLDIFPAAQAASFLAYEDDGKSYAYEQGSYLRQAIQARQIGKGAEVRIDAATGHFTGSLRSYKLQIHADAQKLLLNGKPLPLNQWAKGTDRFGPVITVEVPAGSHAAVIAAVQ